MPKAAAARQRPEGSLPELLASAIVTIEMIVNDELKGRMPHLLACTLSVLAIACGGAVPAPPPAPVADGPISYSAENPPYYAGEERISADVTMLGIKAGTLDIEVAQTCASANAVIDARSTMKTVGVVRMFVRRDGTANTRYDRHKAVPLRHEISVNDGDSVRLYETRFSPGKYAFRFTRTGKDPKTDERSIPNGEWGHDMNTAVALMRSWDAPEGSKGYFHLVLGRGLWRADVTMKGVETIEIDGIKRRARRVQGTAYRLKRKQEDEDLRRKFTLWFSTGEQRIPLKVKADASYGDVELELTAHELKPSAGIQCQ